MQLENNVDFHEFLEVHKSKSRKSAWANDIVLPASEERRRQKVKTSDKSHSSDVDDEAATENAGTREVKEKKKLSDLEASVARQSSRCRIKNSSKHKTIERTE